MRTMGEYCYVFLRIHFMRLCGGEKQEHEEYTENARRTHGEHTEDDSGDITEPQQQAVASEAMA